MSNLKLYLWEEVLRDYTYGVMFALAESEEEARRLILEKIEQYNSWRKEEDKADLDRVKPQVIDEPFGFTLRGGA